MASVSLIDSLLAWWNSIDLAEQLFFGIALIAGLLILILGLISVFGIEFHDVDVDSFDADGDFSGNSIFSIKSISGAFFAFGWAGWASMNAGLGIGWALLIAFAAGFAALLIVAGILHASRWLRASGNMRKDQSLGKVATVYVTVPPAGSGAGQVTVPLDGRTVTMGAIQVGDVPLPCGAKVRVVELIDSATVRVQSLG